MGPPRPVGDQEKNELPGSEYDSFEDYFPEYCRLEFGAATWAKICEEIAPQLSKISMAPNMSNLVMEMPDRIATLGAFFGH